MQLPSAHASDATRTGRQDRAPPPTRLANANPVSDGEIVAQPKTNRPRERWSANSGRPDAALATPRKDAEAWPSSGATCACAPWCTVGGAWCAQTVTSSASSNEAKTMAKRVCSKPGCPTLHDGVGACPTCRAQGDRARRPNGNPYASAGHRAFRRAVLQRDPLCVCTGECGHHDTPCLAPSVVADHWPIERRDLIELGLDPDDPKRGRGFCLRCHNAKTARTVGFTSR